MQITRQSVHELLGHLESAGYLTRQIDPDDKRGCVVRLTAKGRRLEHEINTQAGNAEADIRALLGPQRFNHLRAALELLDTQIPPR